MGGDFNISEGFDMSSHFFDSSLTGVLIQSAVWNDTDQKVVVTLTGAPQDGDTVVFSKENKYDVAGNPLLSATTATYNAGVWEQ
ncbi:hypothetical protein CD798_18230 [Bacillaceae bacterium SAOS 7]|nr:hypothetical protein CD798_18230 [Bacillaceae bacterium SAOS 7]